MRAIPLGKSSVSPTPYPTTTSSLNTSKTLTNFKKPSSFPSRVSHEPSLSSLSSLQISLNKGYVAGILTVDTVADFLPRKGPLRQRRSGIACVSNVAVLERFRRKGIAKGLITKAEAQARSWGCRAIALHCDLNNPGATKLYKGQGFKCIKVLEGAKWPQPKTSPNIQFSFMMKLLNTSTSALDFLEHMKN